jgi:cytoskeleton protein RodZ
MGGEPGAADDGPRAARSRRSTRFTQLEGSASGTGEDMDIGARLRQGREREGKSLAEIARTTKISATHLEALEQNHFAHLPGGIFARAFVRAYAAEVGLDPEPLVRDFVAAWPNAAFQSLADLDAQPSPPPRGLIRWMAVLGAVLVLALVATGAYLWRTSTPAGAADASASHSGTR